MTRRAARRRSPECVVIQDGSDSKYIHPGWIGDRFCIERAASAECIELRPDLLAARGRQQQNQPDSGFCADSCLLRFMLGAWDTPQDAS